jgi:hypothetical protein
MKIGRRATLAGILAASAARAQDSDLRALARRAAIYLAPLHATYLRRHRDIVERGQKLNTLARQLSPRDGVLPASAWLDLSGEPMFLTLPKMAARRYSLALVDPFQRIFAEMSEPEPRPWILGGSTWTGVAPSEADRVQAPANSMQLRYTITVDPKDDDDVDLARGLQARTLLETPDRRNERRIMEMQELMRYRTEMPPEPVADWLPPRPSDPFDLFETALAMLGVCVLGERDRRTLEELAPLRLRPGRHFDARAFSDTERLTIALGIADAAPEIAAAHARLD